ncbi:MAG TPA: hypothetical protein VF053_14870 [Streptosporangiales bacterium]
MPPATGPLRIVRALVVAAACVGSTLSAHLFGGGMPVPARTLLLIWAAVALLAYAASGRRWTVGRLVVVFGLAQLVLHPLFDLAGGMRSTGSPDTSMLAAHGVAALVLAAVMARGDTVLWRTAEVAAALLRPLAAVFGLPRPVLADTVPAAGIAPAPDQRVPASLVVAPSTERAPPWPRPSTRFS